MEDAISLELLERRAQGKFVRRGWFRRYGRQCFIKSYPLQNPDNFQFSNGWFAGFLLWYNISLRFTTNRASILPKDYYEPVLNWLRFNRRNSQIRADNEFGTGDAAVAVGRYERSNSINTDQTPLPFEFLSGQTYNTRGEKTI